MTKKEMMNIIYDTLMKNTNNPQLDIEKVVEPCIDNDLNIIIFTYEGKDYSLTIHSK